MGQVRAGAAAPGGALVGGAEQTRLCKRTKAISAAPIVQSSWIASATQVSASRVKETEGARGLVCEARN